MNDTTRWIDVILYLLCLIFIKGIINIIFYYIEKHEENKYRNILKKEKENVSKNCVSR